MSEEEMPEDPFGILSPEELMEIQENYRKQKLKESLVGPVISTCMHVLLIFAASFFKGESKEANAQVEITQQVEEVIEEPPPPPPPPPPPEEPDMETEVDTVNPEVTETVDVEDVATEVEEVSDEPPAAEIMDDVELMSDVKPSTSPMQSAKMFSARSPNAKSAALRKYGGSKAAQQSLLKALDWLARNQKPDGSWGNSGSTGLALLAYLAHGETPKSQRYGKTVSKAIQWLASSSPGANLVYTPNFDKEERVVGIQEVTQEELGFFAAGPAKGTGDVSVMHGYPHAIKVYALAEAYTMTGNYSIERPLKAFAKLLINGMKPEGDFDYHYKKGPRWDNSISFWNYQALKALKSTGMEFEGLDAAIEKAIPRMKLMAQFHFPYSGTSKPSDGRGNAGLAAAGALCLQLLGAANGDKNVDNIMDRLEKEAIPKMDWDNSPGKWVMYAWYYQTFAMFQHGGKHWKSWNAKFQNVLMKNQHPEGYWSHENAWGAGKNLDSKAYQTSLAALMLTVYYRYLPSTSVKQVKSKSATQKKKEKEDAAGEETIDIF